MHTILLCIFLTNFFLDFYTTKFTTILSHEEIYFFLSMINMTYQLENKSHCICLIYKMFDSKYRIALILVFFDEATNVKTFFPLYKNIIISAFIDCLNILKGSKGTLLNVQKNPVRRSLLFQSLIKMLVIQSQKTK